MTLLLGQNKYESIENFIEMELTAIWGGYHYASDG